MLKTFQSAYILLFEHNPTEGETNNTFIILTTTWSLVASSVAMPTFSLSRITENTRVGNAGPENTKTIICVWFTFCVLSDWITAFRNRLKWYSPHCIFNLFYSIKLGSWKQSSWFALDTFLNFPENPTSRAVYCCGPSWWIVALCGVLYSVCPNKSGILLSFLKQQQSRVFVCNQPAPNSQNTERERETTEQRDERYREILEGNMETSHNTHTTQTQYSLIALNYARDNARQMVHDTN